MGWVPIQAGQDHLQQYTRRSPIDALAELVWNGLDAEADLVDVDIQVESVDDGARELRYVSHIVVTDNGHGITPERASETFRSLGDSWKRSLNGRTVNGKRPLHGSQGRGRFLAYSLGQRAHWSSVAAGKEGHQRVEIEGDRARINGFTISPPQPTGDPTGTTVAISVEQGRPLMALLRDDTAERLTARLAAHLLGNPDITVRVNGEPLDPGSLIEGDPATGPSGSSDPTRRTRSTANCNSRTANGVTSPAARSTTSG
jgi:hypothetical protein